MVFDPAEDCDREAAGCLQGAEEIVEQKAKLARQAGITRETLDQYLREGQSL